jgi:hypothetical protein
VSAVLQLRIDFHAVRGYNTGSKTRSLLHININSNSPLGEVIVGFASVVIDDSRGFR